MVVEQLQGVKLTGNSPFETVWAEGIAVELRPTWETPTTRMRLESSEVGVEVGDGLDAAEIVFEGNMLVGGVRVFVGQAETQQNTRDFKGVVHLRYERNGTAFANENGFPAKAFFQSRLGLLENGIVIGSDPRFSGAQDFELAMDGLGKKLSNVFFNELGDLVGILIGDEARRKFCKGL